MLGISDIATTRSGRVTVACVPSAALYFLPKVISSFFQRYPSIRIRVIDESMNQTLQSVLTGESDFGIGFMNTLMPEIAFEAIHSDPFVIAMRSDHRLATRKVVPWSELESERLISVARSSGNSIPTLHSKSATLAPCLAWWKQDLDWLLSRAWRYLPITPMWWGAR